MTTNVLPPTREPIGATGDQRRRFLIHHVPLALVSAGVFVLWITLPIFQTDLMSRAAGMQSMHHAGGHHSPMGSGGHHGPGGHHGVLQATGSMPTNPSDHQAGDEPQERMFMGRATIATGYIALGLAAFTLLIGPANLLLRRRNPVSSYLRRDAGAWAAIVSVVHVIVGLQLHGPPATSLSSRIFSYFFRPDGVPLTNSFGLANWTGLAATVIAVGLLAISSDAALRKLKARPWKWLQRLNYALFALVIAHAVFYGALLRVTSLSTLLLGVSVIAVFAGQTLGIWLWRRRYARTLAT